MPRELIESNKGDKRYVRRNKGKFTKSQDDVGRSLAADRGKKAKKTAEKGEGDQRARKKHKTTRNTAKRVFKIVWTHFSGTHTGA